MLFKTSYKKDLLKYAKSGNGTNINIMLRKNQIEKLQKEGFYIEATELYDDYFHYYCEVSFAKPIQCKFSEKLYNLYLANKKD